MNKININLLPWREELRRKQQKTVLNGIILGLAVACGVAFLVTQHWSAKIDAQKDRNAYLTEEINKLKKTIKEIDTLKDKRNSIVDRVEVIQELQSNRAQVVHLFDDLSRKIPQGIVLESMSKQNSKINLSGFAQANARVSALMRSLDSSEWLKSPKLKVVKTQKNEGLELSKFNLEILEERLKNEEE